jgi:hypothetical protein
MANETLAYIYIQHTLTIAFHLTISKNLPKKSVQRNDTHSLYFKLYVSFQTNLLPREAMYVAPIM